MTRTVEPLHFWLRDHRTGEMRTFLSIGNELSCGDAHEQARITRPRIMEKFRAANRELIHAGNVLKWRLAAGPAQPAQEDNPRLTDEKGKACDHHEFGKITAGAIVVLRRVNRKLLPPVRLLLKCSVIRRDNFRTFRFHFLSP